jgi:CRP/FNR family transcriptional regulator, cyclic AMP receptor protein
MLASTVNKSFLKDLPREQFDLLAPRFLPFTVPPKTVIFEQGDRAEYLYLILDGIVAIEYKPYDGPKIIVTHLHAGDVFGWSSVVGGETYTTSIVSESAVEAIRIRGAELIELCKEHHDAGCAILEKLAEIVSPRWKNAKDQVRDMLQNKLK